MISHKRANELLTEIASKYSEGSEEYQSLEMAADLWSRTERDPKITEFYKQERMQKKLEKTCSKWLNENTNAKAGTTVILCAIIHVVSFDKNYRMQLTPVLFDYSE